MMQTFKPKLYLNKGLTTPYGIAVWIALTEKNIPFDLVLIDLQQQAHLESGYKQVSGTAKVPMLQVDTFYLTESSAICEYLEDRYADVKAHNQAIYPKQLEQKAIARQIQAFLRSDFLDIRHERSMDITFSANPNKPALSKAGLLAVEKLVYFVERLLPPPPTPVYQESAICLFEDWCIADCDLALMLSRLAFGTDAVQLLPQHLIDYARQQWQRPSMRSFLELRQAHGLEIFI